MQFLKILQRACYPACIRLHRTSEELNWSRSNPELRLKNTLTTDFLYHIKTQMVTVESATSSAGF